MTPRPAGDRRHRVSLMRRATATVGIESVPSYTSVGSRWASIEPLSARELLLAAEAQVFSEVTHKVTMLWTAAIGAKDQIQFGSRIFEVVGQPLNVDEADREMTLLCVERT